MASAADMERYFTEMSKGKIEPSEMYIINQKGRGIGNPRRGRAMYKIPNQIGSGPKPSFISPVTQGIAQARSKTKQGTKRKRSASSSHSTKRRRKVKTSSANKKKKGGKTRGRHSKKKKTTKKKGSRDIFKDIFS